MAKEESRIISNTIFLLTLVVVIPILIGLVFPILITAQIYELIIFVNPFELGVWAIPFFTVNLILLGFGIIYYKKILPDVIVRSIKFILRFEVSRRTATIVIVTVFGIYIGFSVNEVFLYEGPEWGDFVRIERAIEEYPFHKPGGDLETTVYVKNFFLWVSHNILQNIRILPFVGSISLLLLTYFFTVQLTNKRFAGIIALVILMQSSTFLRYDTSATYSYFWALFYLFSLYLVTNKRWYLSHISYIFSFFSKALTVIFLPMSLFFVYNTKMPFKRKIFSIIIYAVIIAAILVASQVGTSSIPKTHTFDYGTFWIGFAAFAAEIRFDGFVLVFLLPLVVGLFLISRRGMKQADSILFLIMGTLLAQPLLASLVGGNILPYRYIPFLVFFAVGVGTLFSKNLLNRFVNRIN